MGRRDTARDEAWMRECQLRAAQERGRLASDAAVAPKVAPPPTEQHYTVQQVAKLWAVSDDTVRRLFEDDPGVLKISMPVRLNRKHKPHVSLRIPASAVERVHSQLTRAVKMNRAPPRRRTVPATAPDPEALT